MRLKNLLIILLSLTACEREEILDDPLNDKLLDYYVRWFVEDASENGVDLNYIYDHDIILGFVDVKEYSGKSWGIGKDKKIEIRISKQNWSRLSAINKKRLMYHELGHDILNFGHEYGRIMSQGTWYGSDEWDYFQLDIRRMFKQFREKSNK